MAKMIDRIKSICENKEKIRNIGIVAHIDHGKTTLSDNLIAGAGMMSEDLAGKARALDFHDDEAERGITIDSANVSMVHDYDEDEYLINLIDTPGHVDFGGDVTRAMRAVDGAVALTCAVEGVMPQTETVLRQALKERVKPILFINKSDRLISELQLSPDEIQERFLNIITEVNKLIKRYAEDEYKEKWQVDVSDGSVCFGSAFHNWALSIPFMKKTGISFSDIIDAYENDEREKLRKEAPLHRVFLNAVIKHLPNPEVSQEYRIPRLWRGDLESKTGKSLVNCDPEGPAVFVVTKVVADKYGEVAAGRLFSGSINEGEDIYVAGTNETGRVQQVSIYNGAKRDLIKKAPSGNIIGLVGLNVRAGDTVTNKKDLIPFEKIKHIFEPVITKAIEAKKPSDLPKLIEVLRVVGKEDPSIEVEINEDTGEHLISGMGELHLDVIEKRIKTEKGIDVQTSPPIVVYRESIDGKSPEVMGKSPNKHNKFFMKVEKIPEEIYQKMLKNDVPEGRVKKKDMRIIEALEECGLSKEDSRDVRDIYNGNLFLDKTKGIVYMNEVIDMVLDKFEDVMDHGPQAREPGIRIMVKFMDVKLHEDAIHRGPAQVYPAVKGAIQTAIMNAEPSMFEPLQIYQFEAPLEFMGDLSSLISSKRGQMLNVDQDEYSVEMKVKIPVAETFGLSSDLRSATEGKGVMSLVDQLYEPLPKSLKDDVVRGIRDRKGLKNESDEEE